MSVLQSLPAYPLASRKKTTHNAFAPERYLTPAIRARAFRQMQGAIKRGTLSATEIQSAMQRGISEVGLLLQRHASALTLPKIDNKQLPQCAPTQPLKRQTAALVRLWLQSFLDTGDIDPKGILALDQDRNPFGLMMVIAKGWENRVRRICDAIGPKPDTQETVYFRFMPGIFAAALQETTGSEVLNLDEGVEDLAKGMHLESIEYPLCMDPTNHNDDPEFHFAFHAAWEAICAASSFRLGLPSREVFECHLTGLDEVLGDISRTCDIQGDVVHFTSDAIEQLQEEYGFDMSHARVRESMNAHMIWRRATANHESWKTDSIAMKKWLGKNKQSKKQALVKNLLDIASAMKENAPGKRQYERHYSGNFHAALGVVPSNTGLDDFLDSEIGGYASEAEWTQSVLVPTASNADAIFRLAEQGVIEITLITRAFNYVQNF